MVDISKLFLVTFSFLLLFLVGLVLKKGASLHLYLWILDGVLKLLVSFMFWRKDRISLVMLVLSDSLLDFIGNILWTAVLALLLLLLFFYLNWLTLVLLVGLCKFEVRVLQILGGINW